MGIHADLTEADLDGIDPREMAEHFRAVAALTSRQLGGMLGWAQQEQDGAVYGVAYTLFHNGFGEPDDPDSSLVGEVPPW